MLTATRPIVTPRQQPQSWWRRFDWDRFLLGWCGAFHVLVAFTLATAPASQIITSGTAPVFEIANRYFWAAWFIVAGLAAFRLLHSPRSSVWQMVTWFSVVPLGCAWAATFMLAVFDGRGSALGVVVWPFLYIPWVIVALRLGLAKR